MKCWSDIVLKTTQRQWNDTRHEGSSWRYWPAGDIAPAGPSFNTLLELLAWHELPARRAQWLRRQYGVPDPLLNQPNDYSGLYLQEVPTIVYTTKWAITRQQRICVIMNAFGFTNWHFFFGEKTTPYWRDIPSDHASLLRSHKPPLLILEDDAEVWKFTANIQIPDGAEIAYLGGGRSGDRYGRSEFHKKFPAARDAFGYSYADLNEDWMRIGGMWFSHAILYLNERVMHEVADRLTASPSPIDTTLARCQARWNVQCRRIPMFWQNDGHHLRDTIHYDPELWKRK
jgi:hypothetical protein